MPSLSDASDAVAGGLKHPWLHWSGDTGGRMRSIVRRFGDGNFHASTMAMEIPKPQRVDSHLCLTGEDLWEWTEVP